MNQELLTFVQEKLLYGMKPEVRTVRGGRPELSEDGEEDFLRIGASGTEDTIILSLHAKLQYGRGLFGSFEAERAINFRLGPVKPEKLLSSHHDCPWWMYPGFFTDFSELKPMTQSLLFKYEGKLYHVQLLCSGNFSAELDGEGLHIEPRMTGVYEMKGAFLSVTVGDTAKETVEKNLRNAKELGGFSVALKEERKFPEIFEAFGWCSWDAFYRKVSEDNIIAKLEEFKEKNIPVKWILIDDGWLSTRDNRLTAFEANKENFPDGLQHCIRRVKEEYGVKYVGVWHAFNGYWQGVDPESALYEAEKENLVINHAGRAIPAHDEEKAYRFWNDWHKFLASCGVDFVKVDNQSSHLSMSYGMLPGPEACRIAHKALERSVDENFGGAIINCMGMDMENVFSRDHSPVTRNSDDFFPRKERGFAKHLIQNAYNALWETVLYHCDFDMWWSDHESMVQSGVLRAMSGSPVYVSDELGKSNAEAIRPVIRDDGRIYRMDDACRPTEDCIFTDCLSEKRLQKVWNRSGESFALAAFNVSPEEVADTIRFGAVPGLSKGRKYIAYEYFTKKFVEISTETELQVTVPADGTLVYSIYPVLPDGSFMAGPTDKYAPIAAEEKTKLYLKDVL